jgi:hypothetical protein
MFCRVKFKIFTSAAFCSVMINPVFAETCTSGLVPGSWSAATAPTSLTPVDVPNPISLFMVRHGEKLIKNGKFLENGNMSKVGQNRAQRLPARLNKLFGCPDNIVAPDPTVKIEQDNKFYYYVRPAGTIEPTAASLSYPLWMPYGADQPNKLADDLLTATEFAPPDPNNPYAPKKVFIAWEHNNLKIMTDYIINKWNLYVFPKGQSLKVNGKTYQCEPVPSVWDSCDFDSIWVLNIQGNNLCYTHMYEKLNNASYQKSCKKAENL